MRITVLNPYSFYVRKALSKTLSTSICTLDISKTEVVKFNDTTRRDEIKEVRVLFEKDQVLQSANLYRIGVFQCISFYSTSLIVLIDSVGDYVSFRGKRLKSSFIKLQAIWNSFTA